MGCDINLVIQVLQRKQWKIIPEKIQDGRSYATFGVLANVRNPLYNYISMPKGLPDDFEHEEFYVSPFNSDEKYWLGHYSHSYYTLLELLETNTSFDDTYLYEWIQELLILKKKYKVPLSSIRVIFGFDS